tara:strand:- start:80 stop:664 length:585 start_codon:yes stop_codon:yes gene_type:complete
MKLKNIINNLAFTNITLANEEEIKQIRSIRNEKNIRKNMKNQKIILSKEHYKWFKSFKTSKTNFFYVIKYKNKIIGGLGLKNYNSNLLTGEWSFYVSEKQIFIGLGASIEIKAIEFFFEKFKLKSLYCFVLKHNIDIIKLHYKFGFLEISINEYLKNNRLINGLQSAVYLNLKKSRWNNIRKLLYKKYLTENEK